MQIKMNVQNRRKYGGEKEISKKKHDSIGYEVTQLFTTMQNLNLCANSAYNLSITRDHFRPLTVHANNLLSA